MPLFVQILLWGIVVALVCAVVYGSRLNRWWSERPWANHPLRRDPRPYTPEPPRIVSKRPPNPARVREIQDRQRARWAAEDAGFADINSVMMVPQDGAGRYPPRNLGH